MLIKMLCCLGFRLYVLLNVAFDVWGGVPGGQSLPGGEVTLGGGDSEGEVGDEPVGEENHLQHLFL